MNPSFLLAALCKLDYKLLKGIIDKELCLGGR